METNLFLYAPLFLFFCFLAKKLFLPNRALPPSPAICFPVMGHLYLLERPLHRTLAKLSNKQGPILFHQFGPLYDALVSSSSAAEECFTKNDIIFANPQLLPGKHLGYNYTTLVWASYGDHWGHLKKIASPENLSSNRIQFNRGIRFEETKSFVGKLYRNSKDGEFHEADMKAALFEQTLNVTMRMIGGKRYCGENTEDLEEEKNFKEIVTETFKVSRATHIADILRAGLNTIEKELEILQKRRGKFIQKLIEQCRRLKNDSCSKERSKI